MEICYYLPKRELSNEQLCSEYGVWTPKKIFNLTGIKSRKISSVGETALDLAEHACRRLFDENPTLIDKVDFILFCTQSPDYFLPTTACLLQQRLGLPTDIGALDFNLGCSGYVYGLSLAKGLIDSGAANGVLLVTAETYSKYVNKMDKSVRTIFGDGAAVSFVDDSVAASIEGFVFGTDGNGAKDLIVPAGGARNPITVDSDVFVDFKDENGNMRNASNLFMDGTAIFNFTQEKVPQVVSAILKKCKMTIDDIDFFIFHQANKHMLESLRDLMEISREKFYIGMSEYGNTVSATIPIALRDAADCGILQSGKRIMLVGFGVGYSWSACIMKL